MNCESCKYSRRLKHNYKAGHGHKVSQCCILRSQDEDGFVLEVGEYSYCDHYEQKEKGDSE